MNSYSLKVDKRTNQIILYQMSAAIFVEFVSIQKSAGRETTSNEVHHFPPDIFRL